MPKRWLMKSGSGSAMNDILDSFIHAIESDDLRWCGEAHYLVEIAAPDASLTLNEDALEGVIDSHFRGLW